MSNLQLALPGLLAADSSTEWVWRDEFDEVSDVKRFEHTTVMRDEVARALAPRAGGTYVDATLGGGGHAVALLEAEPKARIVGVDRDPAAHSHNNYCPLIPVSRQGVSPTRDHR